MKKLSKYKINKIAMIMDYIGAVLYFMSIALGLGAAINDATEKTGGSTLSGLNIVLYGFMALAILVHIIGLLNAKKEGIKHDGYIWGIVGNGLFILGPLFSIPVTVLVIIAGYKIGKMKSIEDEIYNKGVDYSNITETIKSTADSVKSKASIVAENVSSVKTKNGVNNFDKQKEVKTQEDRNEAEVLEARVKQQAEKLEKIKSKQKIKELEELAKQQEEELKRLTK